MNILATLQQRFRSALEELASAQEEQAIASDQLAGFAAMITQAQDSRFGDYQANCAMPLGKRWGQPPREIAAQLVAQAELQDLCEPPEVAGPGFINLRLRDDWLTQQLEAVRRDERLGIEPTSEPRTYIVDFSSPNVAKPMHVGHIRSTVIGDALCRTLRFLGHHVVSDNHLGDWGTQFGMIIYGYRHFVDEAAYAEQPVAELGRVYREVRALMDFQESGAALPRHEEDLTSLRQKLAAAETREETGDAKKDKKAAKQLAKLKDEVGRRAREIQSIQDKRQQFLADPVNQQRVSDHENIASAVLEETAKLHAGDADNRSLWEAFLPKCKQEIERIYSRLNVCFDEELGESFYHDQLANVVSQLEEKGLARESDGAVCVFLDGYDAPMIVRKRDGAFLYATTDLATIAYRMTRWQPDAILYVVDFRQGEHFGKLFAAAHAWGYASVELAHVSFGTVLGDDGKAFKTRSGDTVSLEGLLDEAVRRAREVVTANDDAKPNGPELSDAQRDHVASVVGHGAVKYADLSQNRTSDYVFSYDKMVATQGNTSTYLQYSYARIQNIFAKGGVDIAALRAGDASLMLQAPHERSLALQLLRFHEALEETLVDYRPNLLAAYLYSLGKRFAEFYSECPVLKVEDAKVRDSRLLLCDLVARTLKQGLSLLGIQVVDKM